MNVITILDWVGYATTVIFLLTLALGLYAWLKGIIPPLVRLGNGLSRRKIAIFAKGDNLKTLVNLLEDTKLFNKKNVIDISSSGDFGRAERATLFLIFWDDWKDKIDEILLAKKDNTALVVYAPPGSIPPDKFAKLDIQRNVMVTNFRGRLLNDIVISLMTTSYQ